MQSITSRVAVVLVALAVSAVLFVVLNGDDDDPSTTGASSDAGQTTSDQSGDSTKPEQAEPKPDKPEIAEIVIEAGEPVGGVTELEFKAGETIEFKVSSDQAHEVHLHTYDIAQEVAAGGSTTFKVPATIEGVFEAELEDLVVPIAEISVIP